uniref:Uncharacterized protein n=1 Tax=Amblyomma parvum TaxID=251391 RepID=A0A023FYC6_AMBPA
MNGDARNINTQETSLQAQYAQLLPRSLDLNEYSSIWVNLNEEARKYIDHLNSTLSITSWGLTKNYTYWTQGRNRSGEHPIMGTVLSVMCDNVTSILQSNDRVPARKCLEVYTWNITDGLEGPFDLPVNVTVPMIRRNRSRQTFVVPLDFNNATHIVRKLQWEHLSLIRGKIRSVKKTCNFTAQIRFNGSFAYEYLNETGGCLAYASVPVGNLTDSSKGLVGDGDALNYTVRGTYEQQICRKRRRRRKVRS